MLWAVWIVGVLSVILAITLAIKFMRMGWVLGLALALEEMTDAIDSIVTLVFASNAVVTGSNEVDMEVACLLRLLIFVPGILVSLHLWRQITVIQQEKEQADIGESVQNYTQYQKLDIGDLLRKMETELETVKTRGRMEND